MKDHFGNELALGNVVAWVDRGRSITMCRVTRFTKKKVEVTYPAMSWDYQTQTMKPDFSTSLVTPEYLLILPTTEVNDNLVKEKGI